MNQEQIYNFIYEAENIAYNSYCQCKDKEERKCYLLWRTFFDILFRTMRRVREK